MSALPRPLVPTELADGLYAVVQPSWVAGFVVQDGLVVECAPILARRIAWWLTQRPRFVSPVR